VCSLVVGVLFTCRWMDDNMQYIENQYWAPYKLSYPYKGAKARTLCCTFDQALQGVSGQLAHVWLVHVRFSWWVACMVVMAAPRGLGDHPASTV
jgi:hypothetical protein